ncbi:hypothetical protein ALC57_11312, partial [Trachymyrmex cornetzi]
VTVRNCEISFRDFGQSREFVGLYNGIINTCTRDNLQYRYDAYGNDDIYVYEYIIFAYFYSLQKPIRCYASTCIARNNGAMVCESSANGTPIPRSNDIGHSRSRFLATRDSIVSYRRGLTSFSRRKSKFHRSRGHIGENPFDNGSWGKEHFQPSTVPWQLNPRSHGRPSVSVFILFYLI